MLRYVFASVNSATSYLYSPAPLNSKDLIKSSVTYGGYLPSGAFAFSAHPLNDLGDKDGKYETIDEILKKESLYDVLGVTPKVADDPAALRRAYLARSRRCHPDKYPEYPQSTVAFQKVSLAYTVLSQPSLRKTYDTNPTSTTEELFTTTRKDAEDTFDGVLQMLFADFMSGDFEIIRLALRTMREINPALKLEDETVESVITGFRKLREVVLGTRTYVRVLRLELLHLYDIQYSLRQLPYLALSARLRLTLRFTRVTLSLPMAIDRAIEAEEAEKQRRRAAHAAQTGIGAGTNAQVSKPSSILGPKIGGVVSFLVNALEKSENVL
ncbi:hypothetical protein FRC19_004572 [Serendipita sp. 401]|nr:hypothetical protein FRC19_004572 [Serendipita sp. 401]